MVDKAELIALAERVEGLSGPDREVDAEIALAVDYECPRTLQTVAQMQSWSPLNDIRTIAEWADFPSTAFVLPAFTASLDAAMGLVPEGDWQFNVGHYGDAKPGVFVATLMPPSGYDLRSEAATPALALTAAALRARAEGVA